MVQADNNDAASFAKGSGVFDDAWGAFVVTNFWDPASMGKEKEQGIALVSYVMLTLPSVGFFSFFLLLIVINNKIN